MIPKTDPKKGSPKKTTKRVPKKSPKGSQKMVKEWGCLKKTEGRSSGQTPYVLKPKQLVLKKTVFSSFRGQKKFFLKKF